MICDRSRSASIWGRRIALTLVALVLGTVAHAAARSPLADFKHVSWSIEAGAPSRINAITQSTDGFLWIGSVEGLFRFDGVTFEPVPLQGATGGKVVVSALKATRAGEVWVGLARGQGVAVVRGGRLTDARMPNPSREVNDLAEDPQGGIWVARGGRRHDTLARYLAGRWEEIGPSQGLPDEPIWQMLFSRDGAMWVVLSDTVFTRRPGETRFTATGEKVMPRASIGEDGRGRIWISDSTGTRFLRGGEAAVSMAAYPRPGKVGGVRMLFDSHGDLWGTTWNSGVFHIAAPGEAGRRSAISSYAGAEGLTSDQTHALFEDREGDIWVGTELGLDMFRPASVRVEPSVPANSPSSYRMAAAEGGTVYVADAEQIYAIAPGGGARAVLKTATPAESLCAARGGGIWAPLGDRVLRLQAGRVRTIGKPPGVTVLGCAEDREGRLWMPALDKGLYELEHGVWRRWPATSQATGLPANVALAPDGRAMVLFRNRPPEAGAAPFGALYRERLSIGGIEGVLPGRDALFVSGARGLARMSGDTIQTLKAEQYPWLASINGLVQTAGGDTWMIGDAGVLRMRTDALEAAFAHPGQAVPHRLFDFRDGLNSFPQKAPGAQAALGGDGRVWFLTRRNLVYVVPGELGSNPLPPPVAIRWVQVGDQMFRDLADLKLPARTTSLTIGYTALSLRVPSRVRFLYRLDGVDTAWVEAGARRQAPYANLKPGKYRFHVIAANDDGVWNRAGATVAFSITPAFHQTWLFRSLAVAAAALLLWLLYSLRLRQISHGIRERLQERMGERERIARELHDTLLQGMQGLLMRFQSVADHLPARDPSRAAMDQALDRAEQMLVEGRERLHDLRRAHESDLGAALRDLAADHIFPASTRVSVVSSGVPRPVQPPVVDEIVRIVSEALFNAARHAHASEVVVRTDYGAARLDVTVLDDGVGIAADVLIEGRGPGHYGLVGMRERARRMEGRLTIDSQAGAGATVNLSLPATIAYAPRGRRLTP